MQGLGRDVTFGHRLPSALKRFRECQKKKPRGRGFLQAARLRYCFFGASLPLPDVLLLPDVDGPVEGEGDGLVGVLPPVPARASLRHFSRSAPVSAAHTAGTSVLEEPLAEPLVPLDGLSL
jgi:hypothetical protein